MPLPASPAHPGTKTPPPASGTRPRRSPSALQISLSATAIGAAIRQHWGIENRSHYVRDVSFFEDHSRIRSKPGHFARFRSFALNILRANGITNVSRELYLNALNPNHPIAYRSA
ncbi:MAG: hypothetical protein U1E38_09425 [Rhodospirillales bacterium]